MAVVISLGLTACSGYVLYALSEFQTERHLSLVVRFMFNPTIAVLVGGLVGLLSNDYPGWTSAVGLVPWALLLLHGSGTGATLVMEVGQTIVYLVLAAASAALVARCRFGSHKGNTTRLTQS